VQQRSLRLHPGVGSPRLARSAVLRWLNDLGLDELAEKAAVIVSELVTNAAQHAHTVLELSMTASSKSLRLSVRDEDQHLPVLGNEEKPERSSFSEGGRGMAIVQGLADEWGVNVRRGGKRVWARIVFPPGVSQASPPGA
jgi:anti-sigma regulatory factor (Ser/Thr protein kinase)